MATKRMIARGNACEKLSQAKRVSREKLKQSIKDPKMGFAEKMQAVTELNKRPRDESPTRLRKRCKICGRSHGVYRKFKLCRLCLRKCVMFGLVPGIRKASW